MVEKIPADWELKPFKDISTMSGRIGWQGLKQEEFTDRSDDPFLITGMNFKNGVIRWDEVYHLPMNRYLEAKNIQLTHDDILMTKDGTIGKLLFIDDIPYPAKASLNSHLLVFRPINKAYYPKFLFYQLHDRPFLDHIELTKSGTTFFGITQESVGKYNVYLPPINEQKAIATALSDVDGLIASLETFIAKKEDIKTATMQQLLTGKKRLDGFSGEWVERTLGKIFEITAGKDLVKSEYSEKRDSLYQYPIYANSVYNDGIYGYSTFKENDANCVTVTARGTLGVAFYRSEPFVAIGRLIILKPRNKLNSYYVTQVINLSLTFANESTSVPQLTAPQISKYEINIPEYNEQTAIATILSDMDKELETLKTRLEKTRAIKVGMMQELLTGKTRLAI